MLKALGRLFRIRRARSTGYATLCGRCGQIELEYYLARFPTVRWHEPINEPEEPGESPPCEHQRAAITWGLVGERHDDMEGTGP